MSIHIKLAATATGDAITAISTTVKVAKDADVEIDLLIQNINIRVRPTSDVQDIIEIYRLKSNKIIMKQESSAINPYNGIFGQQGWICPKCGRVYSPYTQMCLYCKPDNITTISNLSDLSNKNVSEEDLRENRKSK